MIRQTAPEMAANLCQGVPLPLAKAGYLRYNEIKHSFSVPWTLKTECESFRQTVS